MNPDDPEIQINGELDVLKRELESAIEMEKRGQLKCMTHLEMCQLAVKYGAGTFRIGPFVIKRI